MKSIWKDNLDIFKPSGANQNVRKKCLKVENGYVGASVVPTGTCYLGNFRGDAYPQCTRFPQFSEDSSFLGNQK